MIIRLKQSVNRSLRLAAAGVVLIAVFALAVPGVSHGQGLNPVGWIGGGIATGVMAWLAIPLMLLNALGFLLFSLVLAVFLAMIQMDITQFMGTGQAVDTVWRLLRDLSNMFFIIVLLAIAFGTMLKMESYKWQRLIPKLVMMAILINFSKTIALIILDVAHLFMMTFVNAFKDIAVDNIITSTRITEPFTNVGAIVAKDGGNAAMTALIGEIMTTIMIFAVALVLVVILLLVIFRMVFLWIFIAISPVAYVTNIIDSTQKYAQKWWNMYIKLVLFGPMLAFFLWFALMFMSGGSGVLPEGALEKAAPGTKGSYGGVGDSQNFANFLIGTILLIVGTGMAVSSADYGGKAAGKVFGAGKERAKKFMHDGAPFLRKTGTGKVLSSIAGGGGQVLGKLGWKRAGAWAEAKDKKGTWLRPLEKMRGKPPEWMKSLKERIETKGGKAAVGDKALALAIGSLGRALTALNSEKIIRRVSPGGVKGFFSTLGEKYRESEMAAEQEGSAFGADVGTGEGLKRGAKRAFTLDGLIGELEFDEQELKDLKQRLEKGDFGAAAEAILQKIKDQYKEQEEKQATNREEKWKKFLIPETSTATPDSIFKTGSKEKAELVSLGTQYQNEVAEGLKKNGVTNANQLATDLASGNFVNMRSDELNMMGEIMKAEEDKKAEKLLEEKNKVLMEQFESHDKKKELVLRFVNSELAAKQTQNANIIGDGSGQLQTMEEISHKNDAIKSAIERSNEYLGRLAKSDRSPDGESQFRRELLELQNIEQEIENLGGARLKLDAGVITHLEGSTPGSTIDQTLIKDTSAKRETVFKDAQEASKSFLNVNSEYGSLEEMLSQRKLLEDASSSITQAGGDASMLQSQIADIEKLEKGYLKFLSDADFNKTGDGSLQQSLEEIFKDGGVEWGRLDAVRKSITTDKGFNSVYQFTDAQFKKEDGSPDTERAKDERKKRIKMKEQLDREIKVTTTIKEDDLELDGGLTPKERDKLKLKMRKKKQQIDKMKADVLNMRSEGEYYRRAAAQRGMQEQFKHVENIEDSEELCDIYRSAIASKDKYMAMAALKKLAVTYNENDILCQMGYSARVEGFNKFVKDTMIGQLGMDEQEALGFQSDFSYLAEDRNHWGVARSVGTKYGKLVQKTREEQAKAVAGELMKKQPMDVLQGLNRLGWGGENGNYDGYELGLYALPVLKAIAGSIPWALQRGQFNTNAVFHLFGKPEIRAKIQAAGIEDIAKNPAVRASLNSLLRDKIREGELKPFIAREIEKQLQRYR